MFNFIFSTSSYHNYTNIGPIGCSLPKTNTTFHQLFKYATKDATFSSIRWENSKNIFGQHYLRSTVARYIQKTFLDKQKRLVPLIFLELPVVVFSDIVVDGFAWLVEVVVFSEVVVVFTEVVMNVGVGVNFVFVLKHGFTLNIIRSSRSSCSDLTLAISPASRWKEDK